MENQKLDLPENTSQQADLERWQKKLLDLSLRNPLLNFRPSQTAIPIICPNPGLLEDKLAEGKKLNLLPLPTMDRGRDADIHQAAPKPAVPDKNSWNFGLNTPPVLLQA